MEALLAKMRRSAIPHLPEETIGSVPMPAAIPVAPPEPVPPAKVKQRGRPRKEACSRPACPGKTVKPTDFETYRATFLTRDKEEEMGGMRVQLSRRNSLDLKFIATCTGCTLTTLLNNVLRHHIETHANLLKSLSRPALSWEERDKDTDDEQ